jgi:hypothetical protein
MPLLTQAIDWAVSEGKLVVRDGFCAVSRMAFHELEIAEFVTGESMTEATGR